MPMVEYEERRAGVCAYLCTSIATVETSDISTDDCFAALWLVPSVRGRPLFKRTVRIIPQPPFACQPPRPKMSCMCPLLPKASASMCIDPTQYLGRVASHHTEVLVAAYRGIGRTLPRYWRRSCLCPLSAAHCPCHRTTGTVGTTGTNPRGLRKVPANSRFSAVAFPTMAAVYHRPPPPKVSLRPSHCQFHSDRSYRAL